MAGHRPGQRGAGVLVDGAAYGRGWLRSLPLKIAGPRRARLDGVTVEIRDRSRSTSPVAQASYRRGAGGVRASATARRDATPVDPAEFTAAERGCSSSAYRRRGAAGVRRLAGQRRRRRDQAHVRRRRQVAAGVWPGAILAALESSIRDAGIDRTILETGTKQPEAIALYDVGRLHGHPRVRHLRGRARLPLLRQAPERAGPHALTRPEPRDAKSRAGVTPTRLGRSFAGY